MIKAVRVLDQNDIDKVVDLMLGYGSKKSSHVWAIYQDGEIVGGAAVVDEKVRKSFHLAYKLKPSVSLGKAMSVILKDALDHYKQLTAIIAIDNVKSRKMARQLGFLVAGIEETNEILILDRTTWRYNKRWKI